MTARLEVCLCAGFRDGRFDGRHVGNVGERLQERWHDVDELTGPTEHADGVTIEDHVLRARVLDRDSNGGEARRVRARFTRKLLSRRVGGPHVPSVAGQESSDLGFGRIALHLDAADRRDDADVVDLGVAVDHPLRAGVRLELGPEAVGA